MDSATAMAILGRTPSRATPRKAAIDSRNSALRCRHSRAVAGMSARDSDAVITTAARAGWGRFRNKPGISTIMRMIRTAPVTPVSCVFAPDRSATAVLDPLGALRRPPRHHQDQDAPRDADCGRGRNRIAVRQPLGEPGDLTDQPVGL